MNTGGVIITHGRVQCLWECGIYVEIIGSVGFTSK